MKLRKTNRNKVPVKYDMSSIPALYSVAIRNSFQSLKLSEQEPAEMWHDIKKEVQEKAEIHIPKLKRKTKSPWLSDNAIKIAEERRLKKQAGTARNEI